MEEIKPLNKIHDWSNMMNHYKTERLNEIIEIINILCKQAAKSSERSKPMMYDKECHTEECKSAYVKRWSLQWYNPPFTPNDICVCSSEPSKCEHEWYSTGGSSPERKEACWKCRIKRDFDNPEHMYKPSDSTCEHLQPISECGLCDPRRFTKPSDSGGVKCVADSCIYTSNPPKYRCVNCLEFWVSGDDIPICKGKNSGGEKEVEELEKWHKKLEYNSHEKEELKIPSIGKYSEKFIRLEYAFNILKEAISKQPKSNDKPEEYKKVEGYAFPQYALSVFLRTQEFLNDLQADLLAERICWKFPENKDKSNELVAISEINLFGYLAGWALRNNIDDELIGDLAHKISTIFGQPKARVLSVEELFHLINNNLPNEDVNGQDISRAAQDIHDAQTKEKEK